MYTVSPALLASVILTSAMTLPVTRVAAQGTPPDSSPTGPGAGGRGFPGMREERRILARFDTNGDGWLNAEERGEARQQMKEETAETVAESAGEGGRGRRGPGLTPRGGPGGAQNREPAGPGPKVAPSDVRNYPDAPLFDPTVLRTIFLDFENHNWEEELEDFHNTDVEVPCTLTVDGKAYPNAGVSFRGASSYMMVPRGHKRSLNISLDAIDEDQDLQGVTTLNLLNGNGDSSLMSTVLYSQIARRHLPAPQANFVKVVVNGESWGVFCSVEQFDKDFLKASFGESKGARWKVKGSPNGRSGLDFIGHDVETYKQRYQIKSKDDEDDWHALIELCRVLTETPLEELEAALTPIFDIDGALWFLAIDNALVNTDGYWVRASDYNIYRDAKGVFHLIPHDMNEAFAAMIGGPGGRRGGQGGRPGDRPPPATAQPLDQGAEQPQRDGGGVPPNPGPVRMTGIELDPLTGMNDATKPLRSRLLAVPSLRAEYLKRVKAIADEIAWEDLGPFVAQHRALIEDEVRADTRKLTSFAAFETSTADAVPALPAEGRPPRSLRAFADGRSRFLHAYKEKPTTAFVTPGDGTEPATKERSQ